INKLEASPGFKPPATPPAIEIPHPWTRSVNGLGFLETSDAVRSRLGRDVYGPFEGHLIGCEYNNQRLVRMSLERSDGVYQGAIYPFDMTPAVGEPTFEGPTVCAVSPATGDLYLGNLRDSAWGGGQNTGSFVRIRPAGELPPGIAEMRARPNGFELKFT